MTAGQLGVLVEVRQGRGLHTKQLAQLNITSRHAVPAPLSGVLQADTTGEGGELGVGIFYSRNFRLWLCLAVLQFGQLSGKYSNISP